MLTQTTQTAQDPRFLLASLITAYPDETFGEYVGALLDDETLKIPEALRSKLVQLISHGHQGQEDQLDDLRSSYIDTFDRGQGANPLYETEYGRARAMVKGSELADLAGFYNAFGMEFSPEGVGHEMIDHISVELEFYALLLFKQAALEQMSDSEGVSIVLDARKKFLNDHLGRFPAAISERPGVAQNEYFSLVFNWCRDLIAEECRSLGIECTRADWIASEKEGESMACGAANCDVK